MKIAFSRREKAVGVKIATRRGKLPNLGCALAVDRYGRLFTDWIGNHPAMGDDDHGAYAVQ